MTHPQPKVSQNPEAMEIAGLTKRYGDVTALDDLSLTIHSGEIFGFLGPNGAGKSTTIDILLDFVRPTSGTASVLGFDTRADSLAVRERIGVLPDAYHLYDRLTARQHMAFAIASKRSDDDPRELLDRVGIADAIDRKAGGFSKGMKQRLVLAMALVGEPDILVLDEPSTGLDPNGAREMREIIRAERDRGATVFFSSHILEQVEAVCDRVGILNEGKLVAVDTIDALRNALGNEVRLVLTVNGISDQIKAAVDDMGSVSFVEVVNDDLLAVTCDPSAKTTVMQTVEEAGGDVIDFRIEETSLEELFAAYTGDGSATGGGPSEEQPRTDSGDEMEVSA